MSDFHSALKAVKGIVILLALLCVALAVADAWLHFPLADYLVKRFCDILLVCAGALAGIFKSWQIESQKRRQRD